MGFSDNTENEEEYVPVMVDIATDIILEIERSNKFSIVNSPVSGYEEIPPQYRKNRPQERDILYGQIPEKHCRVDFESEYEEYYIEMFYNETEDNMVLYDVNDESDYVFSFARCDFTKKEWNQMYDAIEKYEYQKLPKQEKERLKQEQDNTFEEENNLKQEENSTTDDEDDEEEINKNNGGLLSTISSLFGR